MKPAEYPAGHYLEEAVQLHVPTYQRPYSWETDRLVDLWRDVANQYRSFGKGNAKPHFMGALILERNDSASTTGVSAVTVIDGQQRLLTMLVLLASIRDHIAYQLKKKVAAKNDLSEIRPKHGKATSRVAAKIQDQEALDAILKGAFLNEIPEKFYDHTLAASYRFFRYQLWLGKPSVTKHTLNLPPRPQTGKLAPSRGSFDPWGKHATGVRAIDLPQLHGMITGSLAMLELMLEASDEEAGVIFETMNAKGTPLRQFDLMRNSIFVRMPKGKDAFYNDVWQYVEEGLDKVTYTALRDKPQDQFFYEYVIATGEAGVSKDSLHRRWLSAVIEDLGYGVTARSEKLFKTRYVDPLAAGAFIYPLAVGQRKSTTISPTGEVVTLTDEQHGRVREIMAMSGGPVVPIILKAMMDQQLGRLLSSDLDAILLDVQSYLVRWILANENFSPLRGAMMTVASKLPDPITLVSLRTALREADWKGDPEVLEAVYSVDTSKWNSAAFFPILRGIERQLSGISAHPMPFGNKVSEFSIEHLYPQTNNIGKDWDHDLSAWGVLRDDIDARRYALGNLTAVTGYDNRKNGKKRLADKQQLIKKTASLKLHDSIVSAGEWTPDVIDARTLPLTLAAMKQWPRN